MLRCPRGRHCQLVHADRRLGVQVLVIGGGELRCCVRYAVLGAEERGYRDLGHDCRNATRGPWPSKAAPQRVALLATLTPMTQSHLSSCPRSIPHRTVGIEGVGRIIMEPVPAQATAARRATGAAAPGAGQALARSRVRGRRVSRHRDGAARTPHRHRSPRCEAP